MINRRRLLVTAVVASALGPAAAAPQDDALRAAQAWLALVDAGDHAASWQSAGAVFRAAVTAEQWGKALAGARQPLGSLRQRAQRSAELTRTLPGMPEGRYLVARYEAAFSGQAAAMEQLTLVQEADGQWRVIGYFVQ